MNPLTGIVSQFDEAVGWGVITSDRGSEHGFHCIEIADKSRTVNVGTTVSFNLLAKLGRYEAANIQS